MKMESCRSTCTILEVVTAGIFLRRLQSDQAQEELACVIFDEFHERKADAELALAFLGQARNVLRPDDVDPKN